MITIQKLSKSEDTGMYRFLLTQEELTLIYAFICNIRLGGNDPASEAAFNILSSFEDLEEHIDFFGLSEKITIEGIIEDDSGGVIATSTYGVPNTLFEVWAPDSIREGYEDIDDELDTYDSSGDEDSVTDPDLQDDSIPW